MAFIYNAVEAVDREYLARIEQIQKLYSEKVQLRRIDIYKSDRIACKLSYTKTPSLIFMKNGNILENITDLSNLDAKVAEAVKQYS